MNTKTYIPPQTECARGLSFCDIICDSGLADEGGIPDYVEDEIQW